MKIFFDGEENFFMAVMMCDENFFMCDENFFLSTMMCVKIFFCAMKIFLCVMKIFFGGAAFCLRSCAVDYCACGIYILIYIYA